MRSRKSRICNTGSMNFSGLTWLKSLLRLVVKLGPCLHGSCCVGYGWGCWVLWQYQVWEEAVCPYSEKTPDFSAPVTGILGIFVSLASLQIGSEDGLGLHGNGLVWLLGLQQCRNWPIPSWGLPTVFLLKTSVPMDFSRLACIPSKIIGEGVRLSHCWLRDVGLMHAFEELKNK